MWPFFMGNQFFIFCKINFPAIKFLNWNWIFSNFVTQYKKFSEFQFHTKETHLKKSAKFVYQSHFYIAFKTKLRQVNTSIKGKDPEWMKRPKFQNEFKGQTFQKKCLTLNNKFFQFQFHYRVTTFYSFKFSSTWQLKPLLRRSWKLGHPVSTKKCWKSLRPKLNF